MSDTGNIPQSMIDAAAEVVAAVMYPTAEVVVFAGPADVARAVLAAAFAECEVREEFGYIRTHPPLPVWRPREWIDRQPGAGLWSLMTMRRLVITTLPVVVTPNEGDQQ